MQTNLVDPKRTPSAPLLTAGARFIRGFTRIGVALAVLVMLIGVPLSVFLAYDGYRRAAWTHDNAQCIARLARSGYLFKKKDYSTALDYNAGGCSGGSDFSYMQPNDVIAIADASSPTFLTSDGISTLGYGLMITGIIAVVIYLACRTLGWLCAGFTRDAH